jgi:hypothetical protein
VALTEGSEEAEVVVEGEAEALPELLALALSLGVVLGEREGSGERLALLAPQAHLAHLAQLARLVRLVLLAQQAQSAQQAQQGQSALLVRLVLAVQRARLVRAVLKLSMHKSAQPTLLYSQTAMIW